MAEFLSDEEIMTLSEEEIKARALAFGQTQEEEAAELTATPNEEESVTQEITEPTQEESQPEAPQEVVEEKPVEQPTSYRIKANGKEYDFSLEELIQLAPKAMDYTKKMQDIAPYRKMVTAVTDNELTQEDLNRLIDIKKGNKEALADLIKSMNIDPYELSVGETQGTYKPNDYGVDENTYRATQVLARIQNDPEFNATKNVYQGLDKRSQEYLMSNPEGFEGLHYDVKSGVFNQILPHAEKLAAMDGYQQSFIDYYMKAGVAVYQATLDNAKAANEVQAKQAEQLKAVKTQASLPKNKTTSGDRVKNYLEEFDEEDYRRWYKSLGI